MSDNFPQVWQHSNPDQVRRSHDGRTAVRMHFSDRSEPNWVQLDAPQGHLQVTLLSDKDVEDWVVLGPDSD